MGKFTKGLGIFGAILGLLASAAMITFLILSLVGVFPMDNGYINTYRVTFIANGQILSDHIYKKGEKIIIDFTIPMRHDDEYGRDYSFIGWDTNNDYIVNIIPMRAYQNIEAVALYRAGKGPSETPSNVSGEGYTYAC